MEVSFITYLTHQLSYELNNTIYLYMLQWGNITTNKVADASSILSSRCFEVHYINVVFAQLLCNANGCETELACSIQPQRLQFESRAYNPHRILCYNDLHHACYDFRNNNTYAFSLRNIHVLH